MFLKTNDDALHLLVRRHEPEGVENKFVPRWQVGAMSLGTYQFNKTDTLTLKEGPNVLWVFANDHSLVGRIMYEDRIFLKTIRIKDEPLCFENLYVEMDQNYFLTAKLTLALNEDIDSEEWRIVGGKTTKCKNNNNKFK